MFEKLFNKYFRTDIGDRTCSARTSNLILSPEKKIITKIDIINLLSPAANNIHEKMAQINRRLSKKISSLTTDVSPMSSDEYCLLSESGTDGSALTGKELFHNKDKSGCREYLVC